MSVSTQSSANESVEVVTKLTSHVLADLEDRLPALDELYRDLHKHPELSMQEYRTARVLARRLRDAGYEVTEGVGHTGVVGLLRNGAGPVVMLRGDMDALPSIATAEILARERETWCGTVFISANRPRRPGKEPRRCYVMDCLLNSLVLTYV